MRAMSADNFYRMMILLEEAIPESKDENIKANATHDFVDEVVLPMQVDELDVLNKWFDKFDEEICLPNEGYIKYEISSDGLIVLMVSQERSSIVNQVKNFVAKNPLDNVLEEPLTD
ncbi:uncharacterized protein Ecym_2711 [Eremothecium cymbalariae DBVPG|uniref:Uncharacterized protein n=1 Tax=Eremothecium cymbalariae (strain CBS 270.75 / DBVPG 7215 / KCTC 17166 / NRRL Y-17582) TaxID=931890 RepID=G8JPF0_ERECY|nr:Hypothetical protein Ecym_2711 [Eremothecium cymbalariae DBVPG\